MLKEERREGQRRKRKEGETKEERKGWGENRREEEGKGERRKKGGERRGRGKEEGKEEEEKGKGRRGVERRGVCTWCSWRTGDSITLPGIGVTDGCKPLCGCWTVNPGSLPEQQVL